MNTDRPDNDDAEIETGAAETAGGARDSGGGSGSGDEKRVAETSGSEPQGGARPDVEPSAEEPPVAEPSAETPPGVEPPSAEPPTEETALHAARVDERRAGETDEAGEHGGRATRRRSPLVVASVAAAVLLVGGGGAYFATSASGGSGSGTTSGAPGDDTPPPLDLDGYAEGGNGIARGEPNPYGATYSPAGTLPDGPGSAPVYRARGEVTKDEVARLAKALGLDGTPVAVGQAWRVGSGKDGSGPSLQVNRQAPGSWSFNRYTPGSDNCLKADACPAAPADPGGTPVSEEAAVKAAEPVLKAVGQDDAKWNASQVLGAQRVVNADPVVGGLPTYGWTTGVTVSAQGEVVGGSGQLKPPVETDTYPVVGAKETLERMNAAPTVRPRMGIGGCASPVPLKDRLEGPCGESKGSAEAEKETLTVETAVFGLAAHSVDGQQALVPSWLFQVRAQGAQDTFTVTQPAVDPRYVASNTPSGAPSVQPTPRPTGPGDEPTSKPAPRNVKVDGYSAEGSELTVTFTGGVCADYKVTAEESADEVTVTVTETPWPDRVCILIAKQFQKTVQLDEPLGDRAVVGSDGKAVPLQKPGARLPAPPTR
ncbi:hypothetical protein [Streptomyces sp. TRM68367]|uniref:hypothetical protein n=1 Tax=Streptomyces sp. TRM68367 TaxID=2758415 RepID=UPI00165C82D8|nr:hypothetical protein [Streptomyces sp. TRM68367]MBC9728644.1 hypothetical protein [Streptomyces sp. TRM68367]